jgi:hypothetical protein
VSPFTETELRQRFPSIPWREPIAIRVTIGAWGLACRICIAQRGLRADQVSDLPKTPEAHARHLAEAHHGGTTR